VDVASIFPTKYLLTMTFVQKFPESKFRSAMLLNDLTLIYKLGLINKKFYRANLDLLLILMSPVA